MPDQKKTLRVGIAALLTALVFRFFSPGILNPMLDFLKKPETVAFLLYADTGQKVKCSPAGEILPETIKDAALAYSPESPAPELPAWVMPVFSQSSPTELDYFCSYRPDLPSLICRPLSWDLRAEEPTVLIYHTHTTESYRKFGQTYEETAPYRTLDFQYNIVSIGDRITELLEEQGIPVIHDREVHDYPSYNTAYMHSRLAAMKILNRNPGIRLVLDLHRDAVEDAQGRQIKTEANLGGRTCAQIMIVTGTDLRMKNPKWQENLSLGLKLHAQLQNQAPGIVRPLCLRPQRFNQDLSPGALLVEIGSAGNTHGEAMLAGEQLARAIIALSRGTTTAECAAEAAGPPEETSAGF